MAGKPKCIELLLAPLGYLFCHGVVGSARYLLRFEQFNGMIEQALDRQRDLEARLMLHNCSIGRSPEPPKIEAGNFMQNGLSEQALYMKQVNHYE